MYADRIENVLAVLFIGFFRVAGVLIGLPFIAALCVLDHYTEGHSWRDSRVIVWSVWRAAYWDFEPGTL